MVDTSQVKPALPGASAPARPSGWLIAFAAIALTLVAFGLLSHFGRRGDPELVGRVGRLQHVVWVGLHAPPRALQTTRLTAWNADVALQRGFTGTPAADLAEVLASRHIDGVLAEYEPAAHPTTAFDRLRSFGHVRGLRGDYLSSSWALYVPDPLQTLSPTLQTALATVARGVLGGQRPPRVTSFPEPLRRVQNVEVMVLVQRDGRALLWRSARSSSIARSLLMAAQMARRRWSEREQALGGSLDKLLPKLEVKVALLHEDGTVGDTAATFIDTVFSEEHGVAYERRGSWHYSLPDATERDGDGRASRAYAKLFEANGLPSTSLERDDLRLYRLVVTTLAVSAKTDNGDDDPSHVGTPDDVLGAAMP